MRTAGQQKTNFASTVPVRVPVTGLWPLAQARIFRPLLPVPGFTPNSPSPRAAGPRPLCVLGRVIPSPALMRPSCVETHRGLEGESWSLLQPNVVLDRAPYQEAC